MLGVVGVGTVRSTLVTSSSTSGSTSRSISASACASTSAWTLSLLSCRVRGLAVDSLADRLLADVHSASDLSDLAGDGLEYRT